MGKHKKHKKQKQKFKQLVKKLPPITREEQAVGAAYFIWRVGKGRNDLVIPENLTKEWFKIDGTITLEEKKGRMFIGFDTLDICPLVEFETEFQGKLEKLLREAINDSKI